MTEDVAAVAGRLTEDERNLLLGRCAGWGSWMFEAGEHMVSLGLGTSSYGNISFDTPLAKAVRSHLLAKEEGR